MRFLGNARTPLLCLALLILLAGTTSARADEIRVRAKIHEKYAVRPPLFQPPVFGTGSSGTGTAWFTLDDVTGRYTFRMEIVDLDSATLDNSIEANNTALHIHRGRSDQRGPILLDVHHFAREAHPDTNGVIPTETGFRVEVDGTLTQKQGLLSTPFLLAEVAEWLRTGEAFVAIHTTENDLTRTGAIRGNFDVVPDQLALRTYIHESFAVRPPPFQPPVLGTGSPGEGPATLLIDTRTGDFVFDVSISGLDASILDNSVEANNTAMHVHRGLPNMRGPILIDVHHYAREQLPGSNGVRVTDDGFELYAEGRLTKEQGAFTLPFTVEDAIGFLLDEEAFVAIHTTENDLTRTGAIRGNWQRVPSAPFLRGDCDANGSINLTDAIFLLNYLFRNGATPPCRAACDVSASGRIDISSAIRVLLHSFDAAQPPEAPWPSCDLGAPEDLELDCERSPPGCEA